jgi:lipopolysaccharide transport system ATP-binding protein
MTETIIRVEKLGKLYRIGQREPYQTLRDALAEPFRKIGRRRAEDPRKAEQDSYVWALKDASFEVKRGEILGIIGKNGAGKTTLLKILSRITEPTEGYAEIQGRVGSLLEIGTGFHFELTGRENVYFNGAILGMKKQEIDRKYDEIVSFAELEKFMDTPVKYYSSGMQVRLAFAVAAHLEQEILLVDEVLAVGDAAFQKKSLGKMSEVATGGRTVLFVSHNMAAVQALCNRAIWLNDGRVVQDGQPSSVVSDYLKTASSTLTERVWNDLSSAPGNDKVRVHRTCVRPENGSPSDPITIRTPFVMEFEYWNLEPGVFLDVSLQLFNEQGIYVLSTAPIDETAWHGHPLPVGLMRSVCRVPGDILNDGTYRVVLLFVKNQGLITFSLDDALVFEVRDVPEMRGNWFLKYAKWGGVVRPNLKWTTDLLEPNLPSATTVVSKT